MNMLNLVFAGLLLIATAGISGCSAIDPLDTAAITKIDQIIDRGAAANDKIMTAIDKGLALLQTKYVRLNKARCKMPYTALVRYASRGAAEAATVANVCTLFVRPPAGQTVAEPAP